MWRHYKAHVQIFYVTWDWHLLPHLVEYYSGPSHTAGRQAGPWALIGLVRGPPTSRPPLAAAASSSRQELLVSKFPGAGAWNSGLEGPRTHLAGATSTSLGHGLPCSPPVATSFLFVHNGSQLAITSDIHRLQVSYFYTLHPISCCCYFVLVFLFFFLLVSFVF